MNPSDGTAIDTVPLLAKASVSELGLRAMPLPGWNSSLAQWRMSLSTELVYVGDDGVTEPRGGRRRHLHPQRHSPLGVDGRHR